MFVFLLPGLSRVVVCFFAVGCLTAFVVGWYCRALLRDATGCALLFACGCCLLWIVVCLLFRLFGVFVLVVVVCCWG